MCLFRNLTNMTASQPRMSQQAWQTADPAAHTAVYTNGLQGTATVNAISETGIKMNDAPVCELDLTVVVAGREPYLVKHRQLFAIAVLPRYQPGATFSVRVDRDDPSRLVIG